jgi:hypothetical protein
VPNERESVEGDFLLRINKLGLYGLLFFIGSFSSGGSAIGSGGSSSSTGEGDGSAGAAGVDVAGAGEEAGCSEGGT